MAEVTTDATNSPDIPSADEDALYNMSMDELEKLALGGNLEQPEDEEVLEDSTEEVDEGVEEEDEADEGSEEVEEVEDEEPEEDTTEATEDQSDEDSTEEPKENTKVEDKYEINAVGAKIEFTLDELKEFASKGLDYTKKMHEIAPWRKQIESLKANKVSQEDINMLIDLKAGNKDAVLDLVKRAGMDPLDMDLDTVKYTPNNYEVSEDSIAIKDVLSKLTAEPDIYKRTERVVDTEWDEKSRAHMLGNPNMIEGLHNDIKTGLYDKVLPEMMKIRALDGGGKTDLEYYIEAGKRVSQAGETAKQTTEIKETERVQEELKSNSARRKAAALPRARSSGKKDVINFMDEISDDDYKAFMKKVERQY